MFRSRGRGLVLVGLAAYCGLTGCVERRYTIRSDPPGALAIVNDEELGPTPASRSFTYYGPRKVTLIADGFQTQSFIQEVRRPWYDNLLTEFFSENMVPWTIRDERDFTYKLQPMTAAPEDAVTARAEALRQQGQTALAPPPQRSWFSWLRRR